MTLKQTRTCSVKLQGEYALINIGPTEDFTGSFLATYNQIEHKLLEFIDQSQLPENRHPSMGQIVYALRKDGLISRSWFRRLTSLRQYRNYVVHDIDGTPVPQAALHDAQKILDELESADILWDGKSESSTSALDDDCRSRY